MSGAEARTTPSAARAAALDRRARRGHGRGARRARAHRARLCARAPQRGSPRAGCSAASAPLRGEPALYTVTRAGPAGLRRCSGSSRRASSAGERRPRDRLRLGGRRARARATRTTPSSASPSCGGSSAGGARRSRACGFVAGRARRARCTGPTSCSCPRARAPAPAIAVEVELTVKAPRAPAAICRAWARCAARRRRPLPRGAARCERAAASGRIAAARAGDRVAVVAARRCSDAAADAPAARRASREPSQAVPSLRRGGRTTEQRRQRDVLFTINRVVLVGRLTRDPELRALPSGT